MKKSRLCAIVMCLCISGTTAAQKMPMIEECELSITKAELGKDEAAYTRCGFDDEALAFSKWSGFSSQKQLKKAMYELCVRHPQHDLAPLYCQKSADLGYGPAVAELGHRAMNEGLGDSAVRFYGRALATKQLTPEQEGKVSEQLGLYYLEQGDHYTPAKAVAFLQAAASKRSALANNAMGYFTYTGAVGVHQDAEETLKYYWRAILLGCPAAEENTGLFHLARLGKISPDTAAAYMKNKALTCEGATSQSGAMKPTVQPAGCDCNTVSPEIEGAKSKPYYLLSVNGTSAKLKDAQGATQTVQQGQALTSGYTIAEVRKAVVILTKGTERIILPLVPSEVCLSYCQTKPETGQDENVQIKPYRITFTPQECRDIMYYAKALVDTSKPFVGKDQCASDSGLVQDPLLNMIQNPDVSAVSGVVPAASIQKAKPASVEKRKRPVQKKPVVQKKTPKFYNVTVGDEAQKERLSKGSN